jgi:hypothetical protein
MGPHLLRNDVEEQSCFLKRLLLEELQYAYFFRLMYSGHKAIILSSERWRMQRR